jgi:hypothetical protein
MIKMNFYVRNGNTLTTADLLRGAAKNLDRMADSLDKPNDILSMLNDMFDIVTRDKVADKIEQLATGLIQMSTELRGPQIDQRSLR